MVYTYAFLTLKTCTGCFKSYKNICALLRIAKNLTLVVVHFPPSAYVEKANTTQLPFLKSHFLSECEEGLLFLQSIWNITTD